MTHNSKDMEGIQQNIFTLIPSPWMNGAIFTSLKDGYTAIRWWILWSWFVFVQMVEVFSHSPLRLFYYEIVKSCFMSLLIHWLLPWDEVIEQSMFIATMRWGSTVVSGGKNRPPTELCSLCTTAQINSLADECCGYFSFAFFQTAAVQTIT